MVTGVLRQQGDGHVAVNLAVSCLAVAIWAAWAQRDADEPVRHAPALGYLADLGRHVAHLERLCAGL